MPKYVFFISWRYSSNVLIIVDFMVRKKCSGTENLQFFHWKPILTTFPTNRRYTRYNVSTKREQYLLWLVGWLNFIDTKSLLILKLMVQMSYLVENTGCFSLSRTYIFVYNFTIYEDTLKKSKHFSL